MNYGVIDIGTNTIRSVIYDQNCNFSDEVIFTSHILRDTTDNILSLDGTLYLLDTINKSIDFFKKNDTKKIFCFATSAMRDVKNFEEINDLIYSKSNLKIELLSEQEEAEYDFISLKNKLTNSPLGVGMDLGGGSCQVLLFENGKLINSYSKKLGVKRLLNIFEKLTRENEKIVREYIKNTLYDLVKGVYKNLYVFGGTSKKIKKVINKSTFLRRDILELLELYYQNNNQFMINFGDDSNKVVFGILVIDELSKFYNISDISVTECSLRDGYIKCIINKSCRKMCTPHKAT